MLLQQSELETGLYGYGTFGGLVHASDEAEQSCLSTSIPPKDPPPIATANSVGDPAEDSAGTELYTGIRDGYLGQERNTAEQAARQRSIVSTV
jgi:hypothetical protein